MSSLINPEGRRRKRPTTSCSFASPSTASVQVVLWWIWILPTALVECLAPPRPFRLDTLKLHRSSTLGTARESLLVKNLNLFQNSQGDKDDDDEDGEQKDDIDNEAKSPDLEQIRDILLNGDDDNVFRAVETYANTKFPNLKKAKVLVKGINGNQETNSTEPKFSFSCRVVTSTDGKLPTQQSVLPEELFHPPQLLAKLDAIYHAISHEQTRFLKFMEQSSETTTTASGTTTSTDYINGIPKEDAINDEEQVISILRHSLEDAGFEMLTSRDLDLCQALNAEYLLRLSIVEDLSDLDSSIAQEFYPEHFTGEPNNGTTKNDRVLDDLMLYDGRVLVFWRGYGQEITKGRLLLPKLDYLQASIVQRAASGIRRRLNVAEEVIARRIRAISSAISRLTLSIIANALESIPSRRVSEWAGATLAEMSQDTGEDSETKKKNEKLFKLTRYGGYRKSFASSANPSDALAPFTVCEVDLGSNAQNDTVTNGARTSRLWNSNKTSEDSAVLDPETVEHDIYGVMNTGRLTCLYDEETNTEVGTPMQLLERVSISNLIDFATCGPRGLLEKIFAKNELVEPTFSQVVVVWRPKPKTNRVVRLKRPKLVSTVADMFDIDLPEMPKSDDDEEDRRPPLEIRAFAGVPMANLPAVLPKTKLVFRPADALVFDLISVVSLLLVLSSQRFDSPRLDLLALVSVSLWVVRFFFRYSNKLARYDLLVKTFLTSKITHRNSGAVKYITTEAGSYRATRAALVYTWLKSKERSDSSSNSNDRDQLIKDGLLGVNALIESDKLVKVDIAAALRDLEDVKLVRFSSDGQRLETVVKDKESVVAALGETWASIFGKTEQELVSYW